jgi:hypothetical protein
VSFIIGIQSMLLLLIGQSTIGMLAW